MTSENFCFFDWQEIEGSNAALSCEQDSAEVIRLICVFLLTVLADFSSMVTGNRSAKN